MMKTIKAQVEQLNNNERRNQLFSIFNSEASIRMYKHKITLEKIKNELTKFGLSPAQAKVFIYLRKFGSKTAPEIARALQLPRTETYHIVNSLQNMGIIKAELIIPTKYTALKMRNAIVSLVKLKQDRINSLAEREKELSEWLEQVPFFVVETDGSKAEKMQMLQGFTPVFHKIQSMIGESREDFKIFCSESDLSRFYHSGIFDLLEESPAELKLIISPSQKKPEVLSSLDSRKVRLIPENTENKCFIISDSKEILIFLRNVNHPSHRIFATWFDSGSLIHMMTSLFDLSWESSEVPY